MKLSALLLIPAVLSAKPLLRTPADFPLLGELEPLWISEIYDSPDRSASLATLADHPAYLELLKKHDITLLGGPTIGQLTPNSAVIWFRTARPAEVMVTANGKKFGPVKTTFETDLTGQISLTGLPPFSEIPYELLIDGKKASPAPENLSFQTPPPPGNRAQFSVAFGACSRFVPRAEPIWEVMAAQNPLAYLTLGDNVYIDLPLDQQKQRVHYYRRQFHPSYRVLTASTGIYSIWDDHDFGKDDQEGGPLVSSPAWKLKNFQVFARNWNNPAYAGGQEHPGCFYDFRIGDVHFIMTDGRYYRDSKGDSMLGPFQQAWLLNTLATSDSRFKVLCSGTLWTEKADKGGRDSWQGFRKDRDEIFTLIRDRKIPGVFLISGDRHRHEMFKMEFDVGYPLYEFESAKVTNIHTHDANPHALFSYNKGNFFGMLDFDFIAEDPTVTFRCVNEKGESPKHLTFTTSLSKLSPATTPE